MLPEHIERVLYLDIDILVRTDVRHIFRDYPQGEEILYATDDPGYLLYSIDIFTPDAHLLLPPKHPDSQVQPRKIFVRDCIQSGILLINISKWRQQNMEQRCLEIADNWKLLFHDQDILSMACQGLVSFLPWDLNMTAIRFRLEQGYEWYTYLTGRDFKPKVDNEQGLSFDEIPCPYKPSRTQLHDMCLNPKIVHFTNMAKPWHLTGKAKFHNDDSYKLVMPFMVDWLKIYARLATFFKGHD